MEIICPHCGGIVVIDGLGRKSVDVSVDIICNALRAGLGSYQRAAEIISDSLDKPVTRGFVYQRLKREGFTKKQVMEGKC